MSTSSDDVLTPDNRNGANMYDESDDETHEYNNPGDFHPGIVVLLLFIITLGCGVVMNGQWIATTNSRIDNVILNGIQNDVDSMLSFSEVHNGINDCKRQLQIAQSNIAQLVEKYDQMARQQEESAMRFNHLSDQYNLMGQKLRGTAVAIAE